MMFWTISLIIAVCMVQNSIELRDFDLTDALVETSEEHRNNQRLTLKGILDDINKPYGNTQPHDFSLEEALTPDHPPGKEGNNPFSGSLGGGGGGSFPWSPGSDIIGGRSDRKSGPYGKGGSFGGIGPYGGDEPYGGGGSYGKSGPYGGDGSYGKSGPYGRGGSFGGIGPYGGNEPYGRGGSFGGIGPYSGRYDQRKYGPYGTGPYGKGFGLYEGGGSYGGGGGGSFRRRKYGSGPNSNGMPGTNPGPFRYPQPARNSKGNDELFYGPGPGDIKEPKLNEGDQHIVFGHRQQPPNNHDHQSAKGNSNNFPDTARWGLGGFGKIKGRFGSSRGDNKGFNRLPLGSKNLNSSNSDSNRSNKRGRFGGFWFPSSGGSSKKPLNPGNRRFPNLNSRGSRTSGSSKFPGRKSGWWKPRTSKYPGAKSPIQ